MKLLLVLGSDDIYHAIGPFLRSRGFELLRYRHVLKAMDNIDEIDPDGIVISARDFPRHWKIMVSFVRYDRSEKPCPVAILAGAGFSSDESAKAKALNINSIVSENMEEAEAEKLAAAFSKTAPVPEDILPEADMEGATEDILPETALKDAAGDILPEAAMEDTEGGILPEAAMEDAVGDILPETAIEDTAGDILPEAALEYAVGDILPKTALDDTAGDILPETALKDTAGDILPEAAMEDTEGGILPEAAMEDTVGDILPETVGFVFSRPDDEKVITGTVKIMTPDGISFEPDIPEMVRDIAVDTELHHCSLKAGKVIFSPVCAIRQTGETVFLDFISFPEGEREILENSLISIL